jgi:hypothetical protein
MAGMDELPPDPDLDDLPRELAEREGPFVISGVDEDGTHLRRVRDEGRPGSRVRGRAAGARGRRAVSVRVAGREYASVESRASF